MIEEIKKNISDREIKFRGLSIHGGRVYGYYVYTSVFSNRNDHYKHLIITKEGELREIEPGTHCEYTGSSCRKGNGIYMGSIVLFPEYEKTAVVIYKKNKFLLKWMDNPRPAHIPETTELARREGEIEVVGDIFTNTKLYQ